MKLVSAAVLATAVGIMVLGVTSAQPYPNRRPRRNRAHPIKSVQYTRELLRHASGSPEQQQRARDFRYAVVGFNQAGKEFEVGVVDSFDRAMRLADRHADRYLSVAVYDVQGGDMVYQPRRMAANIDLGRWLVVRGSKKRPGRGGTTLSLVVDEGATLAEAHQLAQEYERKTGKAHRVRPAPDRVGHPRPNAAKRRSKAPTELRAMYLRMLEEMDEKAAHGECPQSSFARLWMVFRDALPKRRLEEIEELVYRTNWRAAMALPEPEAEEVVRIVRDGIRHARVQVESAAPAQLEGYTTVGLPPRWWSR